MRPTRDQWAIQLARLTAQRSTCCRRQVGCVLLNERGHVLATGYNGVAAGLPHCNHEEGFILSDSIEKVGDTLVLGPRNQMSKRFPNACDGSSSASGINLDACQAIHAEQNALLQCMDMYQIHTACVTASPCVTCAKLLLNTSCQRIVFVEEYPHGQAQTLWEAAGREWLKFE